MRKIIAFTTLCFFSLLLTNEKAVSKSNCDVIIKERTAHHPVINTDADEEPVYNSLQRYDGFFKIL
jgi:hypothetical protein